MRTFLALIVFLILVSPAYPAPRFHTGGARVAPFHSTRAPIQREKTTRGPHVKVIYRHYRATRPVETWYSRGTRYTIIGER